MHCIYLPCHRIVSPVLARTSLGQHKWLSFLHLISITTIPSTSILFASTALCLRSNNTYLVELASDSTGLLGAEVEGKVLLALVELAEVGTLLLVHNSENAGNVLAERVDAEDLAGRTTGNLLDAKVEELGLELLKLLGEVSLGLRLKFECLNLNLLLFWLHIQDVGWAKCKCD